MSFRDFANSRDFGERAQRWSDALLFGPPGEAFVAPFGLRYGINGVGLVSRDGREFIVVLKALKEGSPESPLLNAELLSPDSIRKFGFSGPDYSN